MIERLFALSGPLAALAWVSLGSAAIGIASVLVQAIVKPPMRTGVSLAVRTAFVIVFCRIAYRTLYPHPIGYPAVVLYATQGIAMLWATVDAVRHGRTGRP